MKKYLSIFLLATILLLSCGITDPAIIKNNTNDTLQILLRLNYPPSEACPDNFFREVLLKQSLSIRPGTNKDSTDYWLNKFDTLHNIATLTLLPNQIIGLGSIRMGLHRTNYKVWEFTEATIIGKSFTINVKDSGILKFVKRNEHFTGQDDYEFNIGTNK